MTLTDVQTDQVRDLLDSLEPQCEAVCAKCGDRCPDSARWIGQLVDNGEVVRRLLHCDDDKRRCERAFNRAQFARDGIVYRAEPLR